MRFIQCARYREEQNMTVFQYCGNIYYRAFRHIPAGRELLVWYDEKYSEFLDIPALMKAKVVKGTYDSWNVLWFWKKQTNKKKKKQSDTR